MTTPRLVNVDSYAVIPTQLPDGQVVVDQQSQTAEKKNFFAALRSDAYVTLDRTTQFAVNGNGERRNIRTLAAYLQGLRQPKCARLIDDDEVTQCNGIRDAIDAYCEAAGMVGMGSDDAQVIATPKSWFRYLRALAAPFGGHVDESGLSKRVRAEIAHVMTTTIATLQTTPPHHVLSLPQASRLIRLAALGDAWLHTTPKHQPDAPLQRLILALDRARTQFAVQRLD